MNAEVNLYVDEIAVEIRHVDESRVGDIDLPAATTAVVRFGGRWESGMTVRMDLTKAIALREALGDALAEYWRSAGPAEHAYDDSGFCRLHGGHCALAMASIEATSGHPA